MLQVSSSQLPVSQPAPGTQPKVLAATEDYHIIIATNICINKMTKKAGGEYTEVCWRRIGLAEMCRGVRSKDLLLVASIYVSTVTHF